jgi:ketol-acid reductoisomerase
MAKFGKNRSHSYDSYISSIDWEDKIIEKENKESLLKAIEQYLEKKYDFNSIENSEAAYLKSVELLEGEEAFEQENIGDKLRDKIRKIKPMVAQSDNKRRTV